MYIKAFESPDFQRAYESAIERKIESPEFRQKMEALAQKEVNHELAESCRLTDTALTEYIQKTLNPMLQEARKGISYVPLQDLTLQEAESRLKRAVKVMLPISLIIAAVCVLA